MNTKHIIRLFVCICLIVLALPAMAQKMRTFKGTVVDESGDPLIGASVKVVGASTGTITDIEGNFVIEVPAGKTIEISYVGYLPEKLQSVTPGARIMLKEDANQLEDVVVVGYGAQKKAHLTGAIETVPMDQIQDLSSGNLASTLSGMISGVSVSGGNARPGENATIYIRNNDALASVGGSSLEPLYVIDGYIYPNDIKVGNTNENMGATAFNNLDASEIESISVLKDAAAAVYGARAANGVILVTTKRGSNVGAPKVSYRGEIGFTDEMARAKMLDAYQYGRLYNAVKAADPTNFQNLNNKLDLFQADELAAMQSLNYDLLDKYWSSAFTMKHSVNVNGATDRAGYFASISYFDQDGNLGRLDYDRWNYRVGVDFKLSKWMKAGLTISGDYGKKNKPNVKVGGTNDEKDYNLLLTHPRYIPESVNGYAIAAYGVSNEEKNSDQNYSFYTLQNSGDYTRTVSSNINIGANIEYDFGWYKPLAGLKIKLNYSKSISTDKNNQYGSSYKLYYMNERAGSGNHLYTQVGDAESYEALMASSNFLLANKGAEIYNGGDNGYLSRNMSRTDNYQLNFNITYNRDFGSHHVGALFSVERSEAESEYLYGYVTSPYSFTTGQSNSVTSESQSSTTFTRSESGTFSYIGRVNYAYNDTYLLEALFRSDSSIKFAPENYRGFFPSVSGGWVLSNEEWFKDKISWLNYVKVRASGGLTGRDNTTAWQWMQTYATDKDKGAVFGYGTNQNAGNHITLNKNNSAVNRDAHWDKSYKANIGVDLKFLDSRLSVDVDWYKQWDREMLLNYSATVPGTVGTQSAKVNYGKMNSYGVDVSLSWRDKIGKDFKYKIGINTGYSDNKVLEMDWETENIYRQLVYGHRTDLGTWGMQCIGMFRSFQDIEEYFEKYNIKSYMGKTKDQVRPGMLIYKDVRGAQQADGTYAGPDGIVDKDNDQVQISNRANPYGFTLNLSGEWKRLSVSLQANASWGGYSVVPTAALKLSSDDAIEYQNMPSFWNVDNMYSYEDVYDASGNLVVAENRNAKYPNLAYSSINSVTSTFWRVSGARVRLNRLTVAYNVPTKYISKLGVNSCRVNITGQNLLNLYNPYPENFMDPSTTYGAYPTLRKFTFGLNLSF